MKKLKKITTLLIIITMMIGLLGILIGCGNKNKDEELCIEPIKNLNEGIQNADVEKYKKAFPEFIDYKIEQSELDEIMKKYIERYGKDVKITYEIKSKEKYSDEKLSELRENIKKYYERDCNVAKGYKVEYDRTIQGANDKQIITMTVDVYEIDGKWSILKF